LTGIAISRNGKQLAVSSIDGDVYELGWIVTRGAAWLASSPGAI
jgi:hypothetical protein